MAGETIQSSGFWPWRGRHSSGEDRDYGVQEITFGGSGGRRYTQYVPVATDNRVRTWPMEFEDRQHVVLQMKEFLDERKGHHPFYFADEDSGEIVHVICKSWRMRIRQNTNRYRLTATFEEFHG